MLEWLKNILGSAYTEEIDKAVAAEIGRAFMEKRILTFKMLTVENLSRLMFEKVPSLTAGRCLHTSEKGYTSPLYFGL